MEDDKLKELFSEYNPQMVSDSSFMRRLDRNLEAVEMVKARNEALRRRNRVAVMIAAACGCLSGILLSVLCSFIPQWLTNITVTLPHLPAFAFNFSYICYAAMALVSIIISVNSYEIALLHIEQE